MFCVVETTDDGVLCVAAVPKKWIEIDVLAWPPRSVFRRTQPVEKQLEPEKCWARNAFKILKDNIGIK